MKRKYKFFDKDDFWGIIAVISILIVNFLLLIFGSLFLPKILPWEWV
jgi:uncharacterized protein YdaL